MMTRTLIVATLLGFVASACDSSPEAGPGDGTATTDHARVESGQPGDGSKPGDGSGPIDGKPTEGGAPADGALAEGSPSEAGGGFNPQAGSWSLSQTVSKNSCNSTAIIAASSTFAISNASSTSFTVDALDGSTPFNCTLGSGRSFNCPQHPAADISVAGDALAVQESLKGTFSDGKSVSGTLEGTVSCGGSDCSAAEAQLGATLPCTFSTALTASWTSGP